MVWNGPPRPARARREDVPPRASGERAFSVGGKATAPLQPPRRTHGILPASPCGSWCSRLRLSAAAELGNEEQNADLGHSSVDACHRTTGRLETCKAWPR